MRRQWKGKRAERVIAFYQEHGHTATLKRFGIVSSVLHRLLRAAGPRKATSKRNGSHTATHILARKLDDAVRAELRATGDLTDVHIYARLLSRRILEGNT